MATFNTDSIADLWEAIRSWPAAEQMSLATRILQSLEADKQIATSPRKSLADLVGLISNDRPPPSDQECERILEEELFRKHA